MYSEENNVDINNSYENEYIPYVVKWGRITNLLGVLLSFGPIFVLTFIYKLVPDVDSIISGAVAIWSVIALFWIIEPVSYFPILGIPGTYMSFLSGNISNLRLPCSAVAQEAAGVEVGTEKGTIIATLGIAVSIIINVVILTLGVIAGTSILSALPPSVTSALNYILPALFGAIFAQFAMAQPKIGAIALCIGLIMTWLLNNGFLSFLPGYPAYAVIIVCVFGTIFISKKLLEKGYISSK